MLSIKGFNNNDERETRIRKAPTNEVGVRGGGGVGGLRLLPPLARD